MAALQGSGMWRFSAWRRTACSLACLAAGITACSSGAPEPVTVVGAASATASSPELPTPHDVTPRSPTVPPTARATQPPMPAANTDLPTDPSNAPLTVHEPTIEQLNAFVWFYDPDFYGYDPQTVFESADVSGDGKPDAVLWDDWAAPGERVGLAWVYQDVSGDQVDDLLVYGWDGLLFSVWADDHYAPPLRLPSGWSRGGLPEVTVTLQDWTGDGVLEVVYDVGLVTGGTGLWISYTNRSLIHCTALACEVVWQDTLSAYTDDYNTGGMAQYETDVRATTDPEGHPAFRVMSDGFSIYCCSDWNSGDGNPPRLDTLQIYTSTVTFWSWTGAAFERRDTQINHRAQTIESQSQLSAVSPQGVEASVTWSDNHAAGNANEYCQFLIDGAPIGALFGCRHTFTTVAWQDLTGDGLEDVVVTAYSAGWPVGPEDVLSDVNCMHQRLIAYQWNAGSAVEIANVAGCVERNDLYGVRLLDVDQDGQVDILAAPDGERGNRFYRWNGQRFVLWSDVPTRP